MWLHIISGEGQPFCYTKLTTIQTQQPTRLKHNTAHIKLDGVLLNWGNIFCKHPFEIRFRNLSMSWKGAGGSKVALRQVSKTVKNLENRKVRKRSHKWSGQKGSEAQTMLREAAELGLHGNGNGAVLVACWQRQRQRQGLWQCQWQWQRRAKGLGLVWRDEEGVTEAKICTVGLFGCVLLGKRV